MELNGYLRELQHEVKMPISYRFVTTEGVVSLEAHLGKEIKIHATGRKTCVHCGRKVKKLYQGGYCYPCLTTLAECDLCIVKPHECHFHKGTCRDESFAQHHCMIPHYVYLAFSNHVKVGLTRKGRQLKRWVDQGASIAVLFAEVPTRKMAGELEMEVAKGLPDKTDWRKMLRTTSADDSELTLARERVAGQLPEEWKSFVLSEEPSVYRFVYPFVADAAVNLSPFNLDKGDASGRLIGVKGQYLLFDSGAMNVRKFAGYEVSFSISD